jgi:hypothetical protein
MDLTSLLRGMLHPDSSGPKKSPGKVPGREGGKGRRGDRGGRIFIRVEIGGIALF